MYRSTKTFKSDLGFSSAFRQFQAESHCHFLHGYALEFRIEFASNEVDVRNWVVDFGSLKSLKDWIERTFDHKTLVAKNDPQIEWFREGHKRKILDLVEVEHIGCEMFAQLVFECTEIWLKDNGYSPRCWVHSVEAKEHGANSAIFDRQMWASTDLGHVLVRRRV